jgi:hypothetical protein
VNARNSSPDRPRVSRQFLVHLDADLIRQVKIQAIHRNMTASRLVQEALLAFLAAGGTSASNSEPGEVA